MPSSLRKQKMLRCRNVNVNPFAHIREENTKRTPKRKGKVRKESVGRKEESVHRVRLPEDQPSVQRPSTRNVRW